MRGLALLGLLLILGIYQVGCLKSTQTCKGYECLKAYVDKPDSAYQWEDTGHRVVVEDYQGRGGWTGYFLNMTSQQWLTPEDTSQSLWWHIMVVVVPEHVEVTDTAMLWMTDGDNKADFQPDLTDYNLLVVGDMATATRMPTAALFQIPNQYIVYADDPLQAHRSEDASIAFTWLHFLNDPTSDSEYILRMPMTKAGVKALDTIEAFLTSDTAPAEIQDLGLHPTQFIVSGASKRGWTTWTVGAIDPRVMAIVPVVMDELNFVENIKHHYRSYGGWSFALKDYWKLNLTLQFESPKMQEMFDIIDPFEYRDKLIMPKLVCNSAGDEFFMPDNTRYWWHDMPMEYEMNKFITLPNAEHATVTGILELLPAVNTWVNEILSAHKLLKEKHNGRRPLVKTIEDRNAASIELMSAAEIPRFNWTIDTTNGDITVHSETKPKSVHLWHASTCNTGRRDFRMLNNDDPCDCGFTVLDQCLNLRILWVAEELEETSPGKKKY
jgi:PhoPQ-activated pathogenicity-related protein